MLAAGPVFGGALQKEGRPPLQLQGDGAPEGPPITAPRSGRPLRGPQGPPSSVGGPSALSFLPGAAPAALAPAAAATAAAATADDEAGILIRSLRPRRGRAPGAPPRVRGPSSSSCTGGPRVSSKKKPKQQAGRQKEDGNECDVLSVHLSSSGDSE